MMYPTDNKKGAGEALRSRRRPMNPKEFAVQSTLTAAAPAAARFVVETIDDVLTVRDDERDDWVTHEAPWTLDKAQLVADVLNAEPRRVRLFTWAREDAA